MHLKVFKDCTTIACSVMLFSATGFLIMALADSIVLLSVAVAIIQGN